MRNDQDVPTSLSDEHSLPSRSLSFTFLTATTTLVTASSVVNITYQPFTDTENVTVTALARISQSQSVANLYQIFIINLDNKIKMKVDS